MQKPSTASRALVAALIVVPVLLFVALQLVPGLNPVSPQPVFHFYIVTFTSLIALIVAAFVLTGVGSMGDAQSVFVGMAFVAMSGIFAVHGAYTPGVIFTNSGQTVGWSARLSLMMGALFLTFALLDLPARMQNWVVRNRKFIWLLLGILYMVHLWISADFPDWLSPVLTVRPLSIGLGVAVMAMFLGSAWTAWNLFLTRGGRLPLALSLALPWLAMAQLSQVVAQTWALSWWLYHFLMLMAFTVCMMALVLEYEQVLNFDLNRYFISLSALIAMPLATAIGELAVRVTGTEMERWPLVGFSLLGFFAFFVLVLLVVRHGVGILDERTEALRQEKQWRADFTNLLVHDLKSPLTAVRGNLDMVISGLRGPLPAEQKHHLERARASGQELSAMIENLLDVERLENGVLKVEATPCNLGDVLNGCVDSVKDVAALNQVTLDTSIPESLPNMKLDEQLVRRIVLNLLSNALKFTPTHGYVYLRASSSDRDAMVAVIDNGPGVPSGEADHIFEKFRQAKNTVRGGAGLGLTFCKLAVEAHGGRIWVEDNPGGGSGSAFIFTLPLRNGR